MFNTVCEIHINGNKYISLVISLLLYLSCYIFIYRDLSNVDATEAKQKKGDVVAEKGNNKRRRRRKRRGDVGRRPLKPEEEKRGGQAKETNRYTIDIYRHGRKRYPTNDSSCIDI